MLDFIRYINFVNDRRIIFKMHYIIKRNYRTFEMRERIKFARSKKSDDDRNVVITNIYRQDCEVVFF